MQVRYFFTRYTDDKEAYDTLLSHPPILSVHEVRKNSHVHKYYFDHPPPPPPLTTGLEVEGIMYRCFNTTNLLVGNTMYSVYNASKNWYYYRTRVRQETAPHYPCCIHIIWNQIHVHFYEKLPCKTTYFIPEQKSRYIEAVEETPKPDMCKCSEFTRKRERDEVISYSLPFSGLAEENNKE